MRHQRTEHGISLQNIVECHLPSTNNPQLFTKNLAHNFSLQSSKKCLQFFTENHHMASVCQTFKKCPHLFIKLANYKESLRIT